MLVLHYNSEISTGTLQISLPGSKSISNRLLILNAIAGDKTKISGLSESRDTQLLKKALEEPGKNKWFEDGATPFRFYLAYAAAVNIPCLLDGTTGLRKRSMESLTESLRDAGAVIEFDNISGYAPVILKKGIAPQSEMSTDMNHSSQNASALLLISPLMKNPFKLQLMNHKVSASYIEMTIKCMSFFGSRVLDKSNNLIVLDNSNFKVAERIHVEADWSSASYFYSICAAIPGSEFQLTGLKPSGMQGDEIMMQWGRLMGVSSEINDGGILIRNVLSVNQEPLFDFSQNIDLAPAVVCLCAFLKIHARFTGMENLVYKESDRIHALSKNLIKFNVDLEQIHGHYKLNYSTELPPSVIEIETFNDHRIAMAFSVFAIKHTLKIDFEDCVEKSFPGFWKTLSTCNFVVDHGS